MGLGLSKQSLYNLLDCVNEWPRVAGVQTY